MAVTAPALECIDVSKTYGVTRVLAPTSLALDGGQVHALCGANGAGKSTLLGIFSGRVKPSGGVVRFLGQELEAGRPRKIREHGVAAVYQELEIVPALSAVANVFLGSERHTRGFLSEAEMTSQFAALCERLGTSIDPRVRAGSLSVADQQLLEIMRALQGKASLLLLDEPTASLAVAERQKLLRTIRGLAAEGLTVVFVSHQLDEVIEISDTIQVLRNGELIARGPRGEWHRERIIVEMVGHEISGAEGVPSAVAGQPVARQPIAGQPIAGEAAPGEAVTVQPAGGEGTSITVDGARLPGRVNGLSLAVRTGEVVGLAGLVGSGRTSLLRCLAGAEAAAAGTLTIDGDRRGMPRSVREARRRGVMLLPEDRKTQGIIGERSVEDNITLSSLRRVSKFGLVSGDAQRRLADKWRERLQLTARRRGVRTKMLSGGNQQKALLARVLESGPRLLLADEPTRGIDVPAKEQVLSVLRGFARDGGSVLMTSSELEEVIAVSDRIYVMRKGIVVQEIDQAHEEVSLEKLIRLSFAEPAEES
jgi:ABC-type sugar transport system ATPase subunit